MLERVYSTLGWFYSGLAVFATLLALTAVLSSREPQLSDPIPSDPSELVPEPESNLPDETNEFVSDPSGIVEDSSSVELTGDSGDSSSAETIASSDDMDALQTNTFDSSDSSATDSTSNVGVNAENFQAALAKGSEAAVLTQTAETEEEWTTVVSLWKSAIQDLEAIPSSADNWSQAQDKLTEYRANLEYAEAEVIKAVNTEARTSPY